MITTEKFPERLKTLRITLGISQAELSRRMNLGRSVINMYEAGSREPSLSNLIQLTNIFGVTTDYLLGVTENPSGETIETINQLKREICELNLRLEDKNKKLEKLRKILLDD